MPKSGKTRSSFSRRLKTTNRRLSDRRRLKKSNRLSSVKRQLNKLNRVPGSNWSLKRLIRVPNRKWNLKRLIWVLKWRLDGLIWVLKWMLHGLVWVLKWKLERPNLDRMSITSPSSKSLFRFRQKKPETGVDDWRKRIEPSSSLSEICTSKKDCRPSLCKFC